MNFADRQPNAIRAQAFRDRSAENLVQVLTDLTELERSNSSIVIVEPWHQNQKAIFASLEDSLRRNNLDPQLLSCGWEIAVNTTTHWETSLAAFD
mmetsp:Transcript_33653/g.24676  ORF Transcript_33653/g.24676 Transcript_33653/m.24676 type:complete len:95 (+) Transcript_33653:2-286(+)